MVSLRCFYNIFIFFWLLATCWPGSSTFAQFNIEPGGYVTLVEGGSLWVGSDLKIESIAGSSGYFVDRTIDGDVTVTGNVYVQRYLTPDMWHNVASPVSAEHSSCFTTTDLVFYYDETLILNDWNFGWVWHTGPLNAFTGYDVYLFDNSETITYTATGGESLNTGSYITGVTITDVPNGEIPSHKGWNLVGNPYPSPVDWLVLAGWDKSDINDAKYIWDGTNDIYTIFIGGGAPVGLNGGTRFIPSNQGFWVQAAVTGTISINNACRVGEMTATPDYYKDGPEDYPLVNLMATGNDHFDEIMVRFIEGTTDGFDVNYDATKLFSGSENVPQLSINTGECVLALQTLPEIKDDLEINIGFYCATPGHYNVALTDRTNIQGQATLYLKDEVENITVNLLETGSYWFQHDPSNIPGRFRLFFNPNTDIINNVAPESYFKVFTYKNQLTIIKNTVKDISGRVRVFDLFGRVVWTGATGNDNRLDVRLQVPPGYYFVQISTGDYVYDSRVAILGE